MATDIAPDILKNVRKSFADKMKNSKKVDSLYKKLQKASANYDDAQKFAQEVGRLLGDAIRETLGATTLPNDTLYQNIAEKVLKPLLEDNYSLIAEFSEMVQDDLNRLYKIGLKAQTPEFNTDKADGLVRNATNSKTLNESTSMLYEQIENFDRCIVDDFVRANLLFQLEAGMEPIISRSRGAAANLECDYCQSKVYTGPYNGPNMPEDIFKRHRGCRCNLIYAPDKNSFQDPWSKKEFRDYQQATEEQRSWLSKRDKMTAEELAAARRERDKARRRKR